MFIKNIDKIHIVSGVVDYLFDIKKNGHKIGIVTNCNRNVAEKIISHIGIEGLVEILVIGNECKNSKPYPDPYLDAMKKISINNSKCFIFEDSKTGIISASSCNPKCLIGICSNYDKNQLLNIGANVTINDFTEMKDININDYENLYFSNLKKYIKNSFDVNTITFDKTKLKGGFISDVLSLTLDNKKCIIKLENNSPSFLQKMANELGLYEREYYFYEKISKHVPIKIPKFYGTIKNENDNKIGIILSNLFDKNCVINLNLNKTSIDVTLNIVSSLAKLHSSFWNFEYQNKFPELRKHNDKMFCPKWGNFVREKWPIFKEKWKLMLTEKNIEKCEYIVNNFDFIQDYLSQGNLTLCHGDVKSPNIFYKPIKNSFEPYFIDWQYISIGKGVQDLVFFMIESFNVEIINTTNTMIFEYYYAKLREFGITNYDKTEYIKDIQYASYYFPFFVAMWFGTLNDDELIDKNFPFFFIQRLLNFFDLLN